MSDWLNSTGFQRPDGGLRRSGRNADTRLKTSDGADGNKALWNPEIEAGVAAINAIDKLCFG